jgi:hypothetical protein
MSERSQATAFELPDVQNAIEQSVQAGAEFAAQLAPPEVAQEIAKTACAFIAADSPWLGPLFVAIATGAKGPAKVLTYWGGHPDGFDPEPDEEKHSQYVQHLRTQIEARCKWLWPLFDDSGALLIVSPGGFNFYLTAFEHAVFKIPELDEIAASVPWAASKATH